MAQDRRVHALVYFCSAVDNLLGAVLYWHLDLEFADMTQEDIIRMAREAGWQEDMFGFGIWDSKELNVFAALVAAAARAEEREACAKVCDDGINNATDWDSSAWDQACENRAYAIRARGQA
jgi:hypothetical protein